MTALRLARLASAAMRARSTAAVDSRSSHNAIGSSVNRARLRAKARVDWARGPSEPSMLTGSPSTRPAARRSAASANMRCASRVKRLRAMVSTGAATRRSGSLAATPMVLAPRSRPRRTPRPGSSAAASASARTGMVMPLAWTLGKRDGSQAARGELSDPPTRDYGWGLFGRSTRSVMPITWFGHSAFRLDFGGNAVLIDPFFSGNPAFVSDKAAAIKGVGHIVLTHGHGDHVGDTLEIAKSTGATVTTNFDLGMWLVSKGLEKLNPMNAGGTTELGGFTVSLVRADHSSGDVVNG